ncbi:MAG: ELM1/GtrOC1 family putative glycosyltransferase [Candidatus Poribacteria bacterium]|nr:ELM1/GtrOC1 family putative glycosyltransferase [Candidatus Poribacteria bacterium]
MKVVILSDKKPGHYKQSLGIVQNLPECETEWFEIQYKQKWRDNILRIFMCLIGWIIKPKSLIHVLLRWSLTTSTYHSVSRIQDADLILSTGSSVAAVNLLLGKLLQAKSVTCRRPSPIGIGQFDLAILPMQSWNSAKYRNNVCKTIGVPNPISPDLLNSKRDDLKQLLYLRESPVIGILLGGTDPHETITVEDAKKLHKTCDSAAKKSNVQILLTTSRRTPTDVSNYLKSKLVDVDWCPLFIEPDTPTALDDPYQTILSVSDLLIVTADSFSMVCEAATSGRKVIVLSLTQKSWKQHKRYEVYRYMQDDAILYVCNLKDLSQQIHRALTSQQQINILTDTEKAVNAIHRLLDNKRML